MTPRTDAPVGKRETAEPLLVEIVAYAPTAFYHCTHCEVVWHHAGIGPAIHAEQVDSGLPDDLAQEYRAVSDWVKRLFDAHREQVVVKVIDAASLEGVGKTLRHGLRRYPAVVVGGRHKFIGTDFQVVDEVIRQRLVGHSPAAGSGSSEDREGR